MAAIHRYNLRSQATKDQESTNSSCSQCARYKVKLDKKDAKIVEMANVVNNELMPLLKEKNEQLTEKDAQISKFSLIANEALDTLSQSIESKSKLIKRVSMLVVPVLAVGIAVGFYIGSHYQH